MSQLTQNHINTKEKMGFGFLLWTSSNTWPLDLGSQHYICVFFFQRGDFYCAFGFFFFSCYTTIEITVMVLHAKFD